jgi:hypothetical protein
VAPGRMAAACPAIFLEIKAEMNERKKSKPGRGSFVNEDPHRRTPGKDSRGKSNARVSTRRILRVETQVRIGGHFAMRG